MAKWKKESVRGVCLLAMMAAGGVQLYAAEPTVNAAGALPNRANILREILDPATGDRWLLVRDPEHPGAPARMLRVSAEMKAESEAAGTETKLEPLALKPVIRGGDRVILTESTPVVDARFEAIALGPARLGSQVDVRLKLTGAVVKAVAVGPGQVELRSAEGVRR